MMISSSKELQHSLIHSLESHWKNIMDRLCELDPDENGYDWDVLMKEWLEFKEVFESLWSCHCIDLQANKFFLEARQKKLFSEEYLNSLE